MTAKELRDRAEELRVISGFTQLDDCRALLLHTADSYDAMAVDRDRIHDDYKTVQRRSRISHWVEQQELRQLLDVPA